MPIFFCAATSTILNQAGYRLDMIERQLAHNERNQVRANYNHAEYVSERKCMTQNLASMIEQGHR